MNRKAFLMITLLIVAVIVPLLAIRGQASLDAGPNQQVYKTETATATITVLQNLPPIANAGPDQFIEQTRSQGANVTLNGTGSSDPDNDTLTYTGIGQEARHKVSLQQHSFLLGTRPSP